jgi:heme/copper-type cytochrome/quinol oxidase subunit 2
VTFPVLRLAPELTDRLDPKEACLKGNVIIVLLALCATAAGGWARQVKSGGDVEDAKTIDVTASRFKFEPATITVAQGDTVRLRLRSADRTHAFAIKAFRVKALISRAGEAVTVEFVADRAGSFDFTCAEYCGTGHAGMKGRLVVVATGT